jgi:hypothetical protein
VVSAMANSNRAMPQQITLTRRQIETARQATKPGRIALGFSLEVTVPQL